MQLTKTKYLFVFTLCIALFLMLPLTIAAQTVNIPDTNLRAAIAEALGKAPGTRITRDEMATLTHFEAHNADISDLTGLEFATELEEIRCNNNSISDLSPLAGLTKLRVIEFRHNVIKGLTPVKKLLNLDWLIVPHNLISDISPLRWLVNLEGLDVGDNVISDFSPLADLIKLERVWMSENPRADLSPFAGLTSLRTYHSWGTPILNLSALAGLPKLTRIDICGGALSDISSLKGSKSLRELYLVGNEITDISPLVNLKGLTRLNLKHNEVSDLSPIEGLSNLTWLDLHDNAVLDVSPLAKLNNLTWLDLSKNAITDVSSLASLPNLGWMGLNGNAITDASSFERFAEETSISYSDFNNQVLPPVGPKIVGPWLWTIVPGSRLDNTDLLATASGGEATEVKVATFGATEGKSIGNGKWRAHRLSPTGGDNLNEMTDALGWGSGSEIYDHVVYGSVTLNSPREQNTTMLVGSDDEVKVWLNGELVHYNPVLRGAGDFQDAFPVTLKKGSNVLLVAVDNRGHGAFSGFFGFAKDTDYTVNPPEKKVVVTTPAWDVNRDGETNVLDLILVGQDMARNRPTNTRTDVNKDGRRNISDLVLVAQHLGELSGISAAPSALVIGDMRLDPVMIQGWITQAEIENDGSFAFQQGITNLQQLLVLLMPEKTALLANYPNPFNPETWIPYQLSESTEVTVRIYEVSGILVRTLHLGHQPAGIYQSRSRAAYWDGKNELGEPVASGIYFYTLTAGDFIGTRRMLIMK